MNIKIIKLTSIKEENLLTNAVLLCFKLTIKKYKNTKEKQAKVDPTNDTPLIPPEENRKYTIFK